MYLESIDSFVHQAEELYKADPLKCRYTLKYRHCDGKLVVKLTDNTTVRRVYVCSTQSTPPPPVPSLTFLSCTLQCLQYKTDKQTDLKKIEKLNHIFFSLMATGQDPTGM